jgi:hypothetical protein
LAIEQLERSPQSPIDIVDVVDQADDAFDRESLKISVVLGYSNVFTEFLVIPDKMHGYEDVRLAFLGEGTDILCQLCQCSLPESAKERFWLFKEMEKAMGRRFSVQGLFVDG